MTLQERFDRSYQPVTESGCWIWTGACTDRYGVLYHYQGGKRTQQYAHRLSYAMHIGNPAGKLVCHKCDIGFCVNPAHLFLGTHQENSLDMARKGRHSHGDSMPPQTGERNSQAKLTAEDVEAIRRTTLTAKDAAKFYGVSQSTIRSIWRGEKWRVST